MVSAYFSKWAQVNFLAFTIFSLGGFASKAQDAEVALFLFGGSFPLAEYAETASLDNSGFAQEGYAGSLLGAYQLWKNGGVQATLGFFQNELNRDEINSLVNEDPSLVGINIYDNYWINYSFMAGIYQEFGMLKKKKLKLKVFAEGGFLLTNPPEMVLVEEVFMSQSAVITYENINSLRPAFDAGISFKYPFEERYFVEILSCYFLGTSERQKTTLSLPQPTERKDFVDQNISNLQLKIGFGVEF